MIDEYEKKLRHMHARLFEQNTDLIYFSKLEPKFDKNFLLNLLKIEAMIQKSVANFYMDSDN